VREKGELANERGMWRDDGKARQGKTRVR
jgi:hypothetical protein